MQTQRLNHVFIVDDSADIRARLAEMLTSMQGMRLVGEAGSAPEAIAGIMRTRPDSVLLDLNLDLKGATGLDVMRAIRLRLPQVVFVVLTNHSDSQYRDACADAGAAYFLDKSTEFERVAGVLARITTIH